jgi:hypothetical protein
MSASNIVPISAPLGSGQRLPAYEFAIYKWRPDQCPAKTSAYLDAINTELDQPGGQGLFSFDETDLVEHAATIFGVFAGCSGNWTFAGGLHSVFDAGGQWLKGAIVNPEFRGLGHLKVLVAHARLFATDEGQPAHSTSCVVRAYPDGTVNEASLRSFVAVGLNQRIGENRTEIQGDRHDRHLAKTAESDGTFRSLTLRGDASTLDIARAVIEQWGR